MPEKSNEERLRDCEKIGGELQTELVGHSVRLKAVEDALEKQVAELKKECGQLHRNVNDLFDYVELLNASISSVQSFRNQEQANRFNQLKAQLKQRYGQSGTHWWSSAE